MTTSTAVTATITTATVTLHPYNRKDWRHWIDEDHDCQDTRTEVLIAESEVAVTFADERHCKVARGRWRCPYTGEVFTAPDGLDIDHLVPLENACESGGSAWSRGAKQVYANDLTNADHLVAVKASANRSKGSRSPDEWLPEKETARCWYVAGWIEVKKRWRLTMTAAEKDRISQIQNQCARR